MKKIKIFFLLLLIINILVISCSSSSSKNSNSISKGNEEGDFSLNEVEPHEVEKKAYNKFIEFFKNNDLNVPIVKTYKSNNGDRIAWFGIMGLSNPNELIAFIILSANYFNYLLEALESSGYKEESPVKYDYIFHIIADDNANKIIFTIADFSGYAKIFENYENTNNDKKKLQEDYFKNYPYKYSELND